MHFSLYFFFFTDNATTGNNGKGGNGGNNGNNGNNGGMGPDEDECPDTYDDLDSKCFNFCQGH